MKAPKSTVTVSIARTLSTLLAEHARICNLFHRSNLDEAVTKAIKDGSLYLPPAGKTFSHANAIGYSLSMGYRGEFHSIHYHVNTTGVDFDEDETHHCHDVYVSVPVAIVDRYAVETETYTNGGTVERLRFDYDKAAFAAWVATERTRIHGNRRDEVMKRCAAANAELKALD